MNTKELGIGVWIPENNRLDPDTIYKGVGPESVIQSSHPDTEFIEIGPHVILLNLAIHDVFGMRLPVMRGQPNGPRHVMYFHNAHDEWCVSTHWAGTAVFITGGVTGVDSPIVTLRGIGEWSGLLYVEPKQHTYGLHAWVYDDAMGIFLQHFNRSTGLWIEAQENAEPPFGSVNLTPKANVKSIFLQPRTHTDVDIHITDEFKTHGAYFSIYSTSKFNGSLLYANMANHEGEFGGNIFDITKKGRPVFRVDSEGDVTAGKLHDRIQELERVVALMMKKWEG